MPASANAPTASAISRSVTSAISSAAVASASTATGIATRTAMPSANVSLWDDSTTWPASKLRAITGAPRRNHADPPRGRRPLAQPQADPGQQRAVSHRHQHRIRRHLGQDLVGDAAVALVLGGLRAVLEERQPLRPRVLDPGRLGLVQVSAAHHQLGAEAAQQLQLRGARPLRHEHHGGHAMPGRGPGGGGAVVAGRGGDHGRVALLRGTARRPAAHRAT